MAFGGRGGGGGGGGGRGGGGFRGGGGGPGGGGFRGGGMKRSYGGDSRGGGGGYGDNKRGRFQVDLNPANLVPVGKVSHVAENKIVCKVSLENQVPMFNQPVFLENKTHIGKSDEIFGQLSSVLMSVELVETIKSDSLDKKQIVFMDQSKILPKDRFLPRDPPDPLAPKVKRPKGQGGGFARGGARGGRGSRGGGNFGSRGAFNNSRGGGNRGGFNGRGGGGNFGGDRRGDGRGGRGGGRGFNQNSRF